MKPSAFVPGMLVLLFMYLLGSFIAASFDVTEWHLAQRIVVGSFAGLIALVITIGICSYQHTRGGN